MRTQVRRIAVATAIVLLALQATTIAAQGLACPPEFGNGRLCTAGDFAVTGVVVNAPDECTEGETISVELVVGLQATASERYDIGLFVADNGGEVIGGSSCSLATLAPQTTSNALFRGTSPAGLGPYRNLDGDACGDVRAADGVNYRRFNLTAVRCQDQDGDGDVDISGLLTWSQNANQDVCTNPTDPANFYPQQSSKCQLAPNFNLPIIVEPAPSMEVVKIATPEQMQAPGGTVTFLVEVHNTSADTDPLQLTSLVDDVHGNLNGQGNCSVPQMIAPYSRYQCSFTATVSGAAGYVETDTVTAQAQDDDGENLNATAQATVTIVGAPTPPTIRVVKVAYPQQVDEPGGTALYAVRVTNTSDTETVTLDTLTDDLYGDVFVLGACTASTGVALAPGASMSCAFRGDVPPAADFPGQPGDAVTDTIVATGIGGGLPVSAADTATVMIRNVPASLEARKIPVPFVRVEPGGAFNFRLTVQNTSPVDTVTLDSLIDNIHGDLDGQGSCSVPQVLAPAAVYACSFSAVFTGVAGDVEVDAITVAGSDDDGGAVSTVAQAQVELVPAGGVPAQLAVHKTANPTALPEPGGDVTFTVSVTNISSSANITLTGLEDDPYGDLDGQGDCTTGAVLSPGAVYTCSFTAPVQGAGGDEIIDVVTASGTGPGGIPVAAQDDASVAILAVSSGMVVTKTASPRVLRAPGGPVEFSVSILNTGVEPLRIDELTDDVFGDLNGQGTCTAGMLVPPGHTYLCSFAAEVNGAAPSQHLDTVSVVASPPAGDSLLDSARALVFIIGAGDIGTAQIPVNPGWLLLLCSALLTIIAWRRLR